MKIVVIRDKKAGVYVPQLMLFENFVQAERQFDVICNTSGNNVNRYPADFCLVHLGEFDCETGLLSLNAMPDILCEAVNYVTGNIGPVTPGLRLPVDGPAAEER